MHTGAMTPRMILELGWQESSPQGRTDSSAEKDWCFMMHNSDGDIKRSDWIYGSVCRASGDYSSREVITTDKSANERYVEAACCESKVGCDTRYAACVKRKSVLINWASGLLRSIKLNARMTFMLAHWSVPNFQLRWIFGSMRVSSS